MAESEDQESKTEEPSQKKLDDAREQGRFPVSQELKHWMMLGAGTMIVAMGLPLLSRQMTGILRALIEQPDAYPMDEGGVGHMLAAIGGAIALYVMAPLLFLLVVALASGMIQTGFVMSWSKIAPQWSKISPMAGFGRIFSIRNLVEFAKNLLKIGLIGAVGLYVLWPALMGLEPLINEHPQAAMTSTWQLSVRMMTAVLAVLAGIAALDYFYQRFSFMRSMRMSREEMKEEMKQQEGDPHIKAKIRQMRQQKARRRMMAAVPTADVVLTNPTHFSVALKYDSAKAAAPMVVAKGADRVALRIREVAREAGVPVIENPPLTRTLYKAVDIDEEIPVEQYQVVAEIISYVYRLKNKALPPRP